MLQLFKNEKIQLYLFTPFLILTIVLFIHSRVYSLDFSLTLDPYMYSTWLFSYEYGFMQRGFIGEIFNQLNLNKNYNSIRSISFSIVLILYYLLYILILNILKKTNLSKKNIILYISCFFFCSFTLSEFILEAGRFDQIFQILTLLFLFILIKIKSYIISSLYILLIIPLITITHEAGIIIFLPLILSIYYLEYKKIIPIIVFLALSIISITLISHFGKINTLHLEKLISTYEEYRGYNEFAFRTTSLSLYENLLMNWHSLIERKTFIPIILSLIIIYPVIRLITISISKTSYLYYFIFTMSPLALSLIAYDYFRWISLFLFNFFILFTYLINKKLISNSQLRDNLIKYRKNIIIYCTLSLFLGPLGVINLYPHIHKVNSGGLSSKNLPIDTQKKLNFLN
ncbi:hypothetical protein [Acinetobacter equi]|uniref:Wzy n=1 Tax=Acinetobacter equi TaxID=1324350 RepID=A0A0N7GXM4_9GAMM|nr:hypothetical protein [Acinetobacter equi]ALH95123.1 hypothetical protein AOY20_05970 [Acinetobacter equi]